MALTKVTYSMIEGASVNVLDFGADSTGSDDSTTAIQAAINAAKNAAVVYFPAGNYKVTTPLTVYKGTSIVGSQAVASDLRSTAVICTITFDPTTTNQSLFQIDQSDIESGYVWGINISDISLIGDSSSGSVGINLLNVANSTFSNVGIYHFAYGIKVTFGMSNVFTNVNSSYNTTANLYLTGTSLTTTQRFNNCTFREAPLAVLIESSATGYNLDTYFEGCLFESCENGLNIHKSCSFVIDNCYFENVPSINTNTAIRVALDGNDIAEFSCVGTISNSHIGGVNSGIVGSSVLVDVGNCKALNVTDTWFDRGFIGIRASNTITPTAAISIKKAFYNSVTNFVFALQNQITGDVPSAAMASASLHYLNYNTFMQGYLKASTGTYAVPNISVGYADPFHLLVNSKNALATPGTLVSNLTDGSNAVALGTSLPATNGYHLYAYRTDTLAAVMYIQGNGDLKNVTGTYGTISDERLKQDIANAESQWDDIKNVKIKKYRFKDNPQGDLQLGVIAQELELTSPKLVDTDDEGYKSVKTSILYMKAVKALQEAMERIEALEEKLAKVII